MAMKSMERTLWVLLLFCGCASVRTSSSSSDIDALMNADRHFAQDSAARGGAAWETAFEENAAKPGPGGKWVIGSKAIGEQMTAALSGVTLQWHPLSAQVSRGGNVGYTWGRWTRTRDGVSSEGDYITVWEKQKDGTWKALFDTGDADAKK